MNRKHRNNEKMWYRKYEKRFGFRMVGKIFTNDGYVCPVAIDPKDKFKVIFLYNNEWLPFFDVHNTKIKYWFFENKKVHHLFKDIFVANLENIVIYKDSNDEYPFKGFYLDHNFNFSSGDLEITLFHKEGNQTFNINVYDNEQLIGFPEKEPFNNPNI